MLARGSARRTQVRLSKLSLALARTNAKIVFMQILSENLELAEYEYRATLNNKTFGGPTATTQHMKTLLSSQ